MCRITMLQNTDPKKLSKSEGPSKEAWISLGRGNKIVIRTKWREGTGREGNRRAQDMVWGRTGEMTRWPWKWMEICNWRGWVGGRGISRMRQRPGIREEPKNQWGWPELWLTRLRIWNLKRPPVARQEPQWSNRGTNPPTRLSTPNLSCLQEMQDKDRAEMEIMANDWPKLRLIPWIRTNSWYY